MNNIFLASDLSIGQGLMYSLSGLIIVFLVLVILWIFIAILSAIVKKMTGTKKSAAPVPVTVSAPAPAAPARGSCGDVKLYNVSDREAAMVMAVVADELKTPINELRFISIKEVTEK
jgi:Na+-transporting methylmalonyl-CoA/oxaloacetate decarboxylase gamma subunit